MLAAGNPETLGYLPQHLLKFKRVDTVRFHHGPDNGIGQDPVERRFAMTIHGWALQIAVQESPIVAEGPRLARLHYSKKRRFARLKICALTAAVWPSNRAPQSVVTPMSASIRSSNCWSSRISL